MSVRATVRRFVLSGFIAALGLGGLTAPAAAAAEETPAPTGGAEVTVIVQTAPGADAEQVATAAARSTGGEVQTVLTEALDGFVLTLPADRVDELADADGVNAVARDRKIQAYDTPWHLDRLDQQERPLDKAAYASGGGGSGVIIYVLDSGVLTTHSQFGGRATTVLDLVGGSTTNACFNHGTHVAGIAAGSTYGVAPQAAVRSIRVLDCSGSAYFSDLIEGLEWVLANKPAGSRAVINLSLGARWLGTGDTEAELLETAVQNAVNAGIPVVVAAGNDNADACGFTPARKAAAITVGATDQADRRLVLTPTRGSNYGSCVDVFAPGTNVRSAATTSNTATREDSGTSMATPMVSGVVARYLQRRPTATPAEVERWIRMQAITPVTDARSTCGFLLHLPNGEPTAASTAPMVTGIGSAGRTCGVRASNAGGQVLTLTGKNFTGVTSVTVGGVPATASVSSSTSMTVTVPNITEAGRAAIRITGSGGTSAATDAAVDLFFRDVAPGKSFEPEISSLARTRAVRGYEDGTFRSGDGLSRGAFAVILFRIVNPGVPDPVCTGSAVDRAFKDVGTTSSQCGPIEWAADNGLIRGYSDRTYRPRNTLNRGAAMAILFRLAHPGQPDPSCPTKPFPDVSTGNPLCGAIRIMAGAEITTGYSDGTFRPDALVSRAALAAFLTRTLTYMDS